MRHIHLLLIALLFTTVLNAAQSTTPAHAASTITVNSSNDDTIIDGKCTLREALTNANDNAPTFPDCASGSSADTIKFSSSLSAQPILLNSPLPTIRDTNGVSIDGSGAQIAINGNDTFRILNIASGVPATIKNLTLTSGYGLGGNLYNAGTLDIENSTLMDGNGVSGGALYNDNGAVVINNSTFTGNSAKWGSAIYNNDGIVTINNATIYQNSVLDSGTGIIYNNSLTFNVKNTILADGGGADLCGGIQLSDASANNLADDASCGPSFTQVSAADLALGPLTDNGGSPPTFSLLSGSAAINAGDGCPPPNTDQRGVTRPQGSACDIGAYELKTSLTVSPATLAFGNGVIGAPSSPKVVTITNTGETDINIGAITVTGDFSLTDDLCSNQAIAVTGNCTFSVIFSPKNDQYKTGAVTIPNNSAAAAISVALNGTGIYGTNILLNGRLNWPFSRPYGWRFGSFKIFSILDCKVSRSPNCSIRFKGNKNRLMSIQQGVQKSGKAGDRYLIALSSKADFVPAGGKYRGELVFYGPYKQPLVFPLNFSTGTHDWETLSQIVTVPQKYYFYIFRLSYQNTSGTVWFDDAFVIKLP